MFCAAKRFLDQGESMQPHRLTLCSVWLKLTLILLQAKHPHGVELALNLAIIIVFALLGITAGIGSIRQIIVHSSQYALFH